MNRGYLSLGNYASQMDVFREANVFRHLTAEGFRTLQNARFLELLRFHAAQGWYRKLLEQQGVSPNDVKSIDDITLLPVTDSAIFERLSVASHDSVRFYETSGTTGRPKRVSYTAAEVAISNRIKARAFAYSGVKPDAMLFSATAYGQWASGHMTQVAGEHIGFTIAADFRNPVDFHVDRIEEFSPDYIVCFPTFLINLEEGLAF